MTPPLWLVTGGRGAGKTTFCRSFCTHARSAGWDVAGLLSPGIFENNRKKGIRTEDLRSGETCTLASILSNPPFDQPLGKWYFDASAIDWGNHVLETCLPCDLFLVDEIGPFEIKQGKGWSSAIPAFRQPAYRLGILVIRPELERTVRTILPVAGTISLVPSQDPATEALHWWKNLSGVNHD